MNPTHLHYSRAGADGADEDWWYLTSKKDGTACVRHRWHHRNRVTGRSEIGDDEYSVAEALREELPPDVRARLMEISQGLESPQSASDRCR